MRRFWGWLKSKFKRKKRVRTVTRPLQRVEYNGELLTAEIHAMTGFSDREANKFMVAIELMLKIWNSVEFRNDIINQPMIRTNGMTSSQVYELFMSGKDQYNNKSDNDIDIDITLYYKNNNTIGFTYKNTFATHLNRKFFGRNGFAMITSNVTHEAMHNFLFSHKAQWYSQMSVPYCFGNVVYKLCRQVENGRVLTPLSISN